MPGPLPPQCGRSSTVAIQKKCHQFEGSHAPINSKSCQRPNQQKVCLELSTSQALGPKSIILQFLGSLFFLDLPKILRHPKKMRVNFFQLPEAEADEKESIDLTPPPSVGNPWVVKVERWGSWGVWGWISALFLQKMRLFFFWVEDVFYRSFFCKEGVE